MSEAEKSARTEENRTSSSNRESEDKNIVIKGVPPRTSDTADLGPKPADSTGKAAAAGQIEDAHKTELNTLKSGYNNGDIDSRRNTRASHKIEPERDQEKQGEKEADVQSEHRRSFYKRYRIVIHLAIFLLFTAWWIVGLIKHRATTAQWLKPFLLWLAITLRIIFCWIPVSIITRPMKWTWNYTAVPFKNIIPHKLRLPLAALLVIAVFLVGTFATAETPQNQRKDRAVSLFGLVVALLGLYATSRNRRAIPWQTVIVGMLVQFIVGLFVLRTDAGYDIFNFVSELARDLLGFSKDGLAFLTDAPFSNRSWLIVSVLPAIVFFISLIQLLFYYGIIQWFVLKFSTFFFWSMKVSGAEAVVATASPFIGQGESAILIKPFLPYFTKAEIHQIMCSGFATIAGSVLIAYISFGVNSQALTSSCIMSIPSSLAMSKIRYPETEESITAGRIIIPNNDEHNKASNALHAFAQGAWLGIKVAGTIAANLLVIVSLVALINGLLTWWGSYFDINNPPLTLNMLAGYVCYPIAFLLGIPRNELYPVGQLLGEKFIINEFAAYKDLTSNDAYKDLSGRAVLITTYALCSFSNLGSLGIQIGVLSQIAPERAGDVSRVAVSALLTGAISTFTSAAIAGMLITDEGKFVQQKS